jgi:hypothetical protein
MVAADDTPGNVTNAMVMAARNGKNLFGTQWSFCTLRISPEKASAVNQLCKL